MDFYCTAFLPLLYRNLKTREDFVKTLLELKRTEGFFNALLEVLPGQNNSYKDKKINRDKDVVRDGQKGHGHQLGDKVSRLIQMCTVTSIAPDKRAISVRKIFFLISLYVMGNSLGNASASGF